MKFRVPFFSLLSTVMFGEFAEAKEKGNKKYNPNIILAAADGGTDPLITGGIFAADQLKDWEERNKRYQECPECVASQPYPGE